MHEDAAIGAVGDAVAGDLQAARLDRIDAGIGGPGNLGVLDAAGDALERDAVLAAADDLAIVDDRMAHAPEIDQPCVLSLEPAVGAVEDEAGEFDMLGVLGDQHMAVAAIDDARGAGHAGEAHARRQRQVGHDIDAGRQEQRHVAVRRRLQHAAKALLWSSSAPGCTPSSVASIEPRIEAVMMPSRLPAAALPGRASSAERGKPGGVAKKRRLFSIGTGPAATGVALQMSCQLE